jgi:WD40 repeat protein
LAADDIFISYTRLDASTYAAGLADELTKKGFSCFIDKLGTDPDKDLPDMLLRKLKSCAMLVIVGTERAATRQTIADEVKEFLATGRKSCVVPIDFSGAIYRASWYSLVEGVAPEPEKNPTALDDGEPSLSVLSRIEKQFNYTRRNQRLRRAATSMAIVFALLLLAGIGAGVYARQQIVLASAERERALQARVEADKARSDANTEREAARIAKIDAERERANAAEQKTKAEKADADARLAADRASKAARREEVARALEAKATANARLQERIASSRAKATASLRFGAAEPDHALTESIDAYRLHPTAEARSSLLASLELYPNLVGLAHESPNPIESLASARNGAVLVSSDDTGRILFWDAARKHVFKRIEPPAKRIYTVRLACVPGGSVCAADYLGEHLRVYEIGNRGEEYEVIERGTFNPPLDVNIPVSISPVFAKPNLLVRIGDASNYNRTQDVALIDLAQATPRPEIKKLAVPQDVTREEFGSARVMTASPATKIIAIGFNRGIALWDIDTLDRPATWIRHPKGWTGAGYLTDSLSFSPDGQYLAVSVNGGHVAVWDLGDDEPKLVNDPHQNVGTFVALFNRSLQDREATYMVTAKRTGEMSLGDIWNPATELKSFKPRISALIPTGDSGSIATGSSDGLLALWEMGHTTSLRQSLTAMVQYPRAFAFGRTTGLLYAAAGLQSKDDTGSALWREEHGRYELLSPDQKRPEFAAGEFGLQLLPETSSEYFILRDVYGARADEIRVEIKHTPSAPRAISRDGRSLAVGESATRPWDTSVVEPTSIIVWDISDKTHPRKLNSLNFDGRPVSIAFGEDGATLAASYDNGRVVLWDYLKGTSRKQFLVAESRDSSPGRKHSAGRVALSPDGRLLASKSDGPISLWEVETGLLLAQLGPDIYPFRIGEDYPSGWIVFSRDGKSLIVAGGYSDGVIDVWNLDPESWAAMVSNIIGRR